MGLGLGLDGEMALFIVVIFIEGWCGSNYLNGLVSYGIYIPVNVAVLPVYWWEKKPGKQYNNDPLLVGFLEEINQNPNLDHLSKYQAGPAQFPL